MGMAPPWDKPASLTQTCDAGWLNGVAVRPTPLSPLGTMFHYLNILWVNLVEACNLTLPMGK
jgi:hypothetical protein